MRRIGLDIGEKRIGVAVSDPAGRISSPLAVVDARKAFRDAAELLRIVEDYEVGAAVVGLPRSMDGSEGPQAARTRALAERLESALGIPFTYVDERLSSSEAHRRMAEAGLTEREQRGKVDMIAAAIILQSYLDSHAEEVDE